MSWIHEFGREYDVPRKIVDLVIAGLASDLSWHNDLAPSFGTVSKDGKLEIRIWVEHPDKDQRELDDMSRYIVTGVKNGKEYLTEQISGVEAAINRYLKALRDAVKSQ